MSYALRAASQFDVYTIPLPVKEVSEGELHKTRDEGSKIVVPVSVCALPPCLNVHSFHACLSRKFLNVKYNVMLVKSVRF